MFPRCLPVGICQKRRLFHPQSSFIAGVRSVFVAVVSSVNTQISTSFDSVHMLTFVVAASRQYVYPASQGQASSMKSGVRLQRLQLCVSVPQTAIGMLYSQRSNLLSVSATNRTTCQPMDESLLQGPALLFRLMPMLKPPSFRQLL
jgi:hypothetical protein